MDKATLLVVGILALPAVSNIDSDKRFWKAERERVRGFDMDAGRAP